LAAIFSSQSGASGGEISQAPKDDTKAEKEMRKRENSHDQPTIWLR